MNAQTELIPKTAADEAREVLIHLEAEVEKRDKALVAAREKYHEAVEWADKQRELVQRLEAQEREAIATEAVSETLEPEPGEPEDDEDGIMDAELLAIDGVATTEDGIPYETRTGQVLDQTPADGPGEGVVFVLWPDMQDPVESDVGPHTRYSEFIYDGLNDGESADSFEVRGPVPDEWDEGDPLPVCDPHAVIPREQWGQTFMVVTEHGAPA